MDIIEERYNVLIGGDVQLTRYTYSWDSQRLVFQLYTN